VTVRRPRSSFVGVCAAVCGGIAVVGVLGACAGAAEATITLTTGGETDAFGRSPAPTSLVVEARGLDGALTEIARTALPTDTLSLGDRTRTDAAALRVTAYDPAGKALLRGETLFLQYGALENASLSVFIQRAGELARLPASPPALEAPLAEVALARYLLQTSGTQASIYDLLLLRTLEGTPTLPRPVRSLAVHGEAAVLIDDQGASTLDLTTNSSAALAPPAGGTFAEVAGGSTVTSADGTTYVVGGTRLRGGPSARVFVIATDGNGSFVSLGTPREGACATYVEGRGLVVVGGSATGPGAEVLAAGTTASSALALPSDGVRGCGAAALDGTRVVVAGGVGSPADQNGFAPVRVIDLSCGAACVPTVWPGAAPLVRADAVALAPDAALVLGDDATGATRAFRASAAATVDVPLKAPRRGARLIALPMAGFSAVVGGASPLEQYVD